jgi:ribonuclease HII
MSAKRKILAVEVKKQDRKKYRSISTHPQGIGKAAWPTLIVPNAIYLDEVGAGAWCGPLTVCAVFLLPEFNIQGIHDSKKLKPHEREKLSQELKLNPYIIFHIEHITNKELDLLGGLGKAWQEAMKRVTESLQRKLQLLNLKATCIVVDGNKPFLCNLPIECVKNADSIYVGVASASILAKVERDAIMVAKAKYYPDFETIFKDGKGYRHSQVHDHLIERGIYTDLHRKTYNPLKKMLTSTFFASHMLPAQTEIRN